MGLVLTLPLVVLLKGRVWTGLLGMFVVVLLVVGAVRRVRTLRGPSGAATRKDAPCAGRNGHGAARWCGSSCDCNT